jgi:glycosyltransferase involved in cell wall biosynthesis
MTDDGRLGRAVILVGNPAAPYSRAVRLARTLSREGYAVEIAAVAAPGLADHERIEYWELRRYRPSGIWSRLGRSVSAGGAGPATTRAPSSLSWVHRALNRARRAVGSVRRWVLWPHTVRGWWATLARELRPADLYHATGSLTVAAALAARARAPIGPGGRPARVIYDAVDDVMESNNVLDMPAFLRRVHERRETRWARAADGLTTVNEPLAERLAARWGRPVVVVPNYPELHGAAAASAASGPLRRELGVGPDARIVLFQGRLGPRLGLDAAADAVLAVPDAILVVLGFGRGFDSARARDAEPPWAGRHYTIAARHPDDLLDWTADADVALIPLPPVSLNQRLSSPNKFWEAVGAGTPVVVPESLSFMASVVRAEDLGVVAASASATDLAVGIRQAFDRLTTDPTWRSRIRVAALERHAWPIAEASYLEVVRGLGPGGTRGAGGPGSNRPA